MGDIRVATAHDDVASKRCGRAMRRLIADLSTLPAYGRCPMRTQPSSPSRQPLPWPESRGQGRRERVGEWSLNNEQVARFDALLHDVHPDAPRIDADRLAQLSRWLLALPPDEARDVLDERLARI